MVSLHPGHSSPAYASPMWLVIYEVCELNNKKGLGDRHLLEVVRFLSLGGAQGSWDHVTGMRQPVLSF